LPLPFDERSAAAHDPILWINVMDVIAEYATETNGDNALACDL